MRFAEPAIVIQEIRDVPAEVPMPATEGRRYTFLVALGYDKLHAASVAVGQAAAPPDLAERYQLCGRCSRAGR